MRRREAIAILGGAAAWPVVTRAQPRTIHRIGFLGGGSPGPVAHLLAAFRTGLGETGFVEGSNLTIAYRWAEGRYDRLPALAADLVREQVTAIAATGGTSSVLAATDATATIPIVFVSGGDPVEMGFVASLNRHGGNVTGINMLATRLNAKRLSLLRELVPAASTVAVLLNPNNRNAGAQLHEIQDVARALALRVGILHTGDEREIADAFAAAAEARADAMLVAADPYLFAHRDRITALAARAAIPAMYEQREFTLAGGLMSYGTSLAYAYRKAGVYLGRILKGERVADLPVDQSTRFEFVVNLGAAKALGLTVPNSLLVQADEVIE